MVKQVESCGRHVYIASPYTVGNQAENVRRQIDAAEAVIKAGHFPYVPLLNHFWHFCCPHDAEYWMRQDREWLLACHVLIRLPGPSVGADEEERLARVWGIPVFASVEDFLSGRVKSAESGEALRGR